MVDDKIYLNKEQFWIWRYNHKVGIKSRRLVGGRIYDWYKQRDDGYLRFKSEVNRAKGGNQLYVNQETVVKKRNLRHCWCASYTNQQTWRFLITMKTRFRPLFIGYV
jgi:hypothetical protein